MIAIYPSKIKTKNLKNTPEITNAKQQKKKENLQPYLAYVSTKQY